MQTPLSIGRRMKPIRLFPYTNTKTDAWDIIKKADQDPYDKDNILLLYSRYSIKPGTNGDEYKNGWNREHIFCQSYLHESAGAPGKATDCHNLFASDPSINSTRSNKIYDTGGGRVVDNSPHPKYASEPGKYHLEAFCDSDSFEPPDISKGVCARAMFYMACVYANDGVQLGEESDRSIKKMGKLSTLLDWNKKFPPSTWEISRNHVIESFQGNRNIFIDDHLLANDVQWVPKITTNHLCSSAPKSHFVSLNYFEPFINEIHYNNTGVDTNEGVEVCTHSTESVTELLVLFYNGKDGCIYKTCYLSEFEAGSCYTELGVKIFFLMCSGIQNGGTHGDGVALIKGGKVIEFLSYGATFCAHMGPCRGMISTEIRVFETSKTKEFASLQKVGKGKCSEDFKWALSCQNNFGELNSEQVFSSHSECTDEMSNQRV